MKKHKKLNKSKKNHLHFSPEQFNPLRDHFSRTSSREIPHIHTFAQFSISGPESMETSRGTKGFPGYRSAFRVCGTTPMAPHMIDGDVYLNYYNLCR